jgi:hypothetical protein
LKKHKLEITVILKDLEEQGINLGVVKHEP